MRILVFLCLNLLASAAGAYEISSYAQVNDDASLRIKNKTVHLHGIHIPDTRRTCDQHRRPVICGSRAFVALEFKIDGFVRCDLKERLQDGSYAGQCRVNATRFDEGDDLAAYLLEKGWALALPDAPFEYHALERIARSREFGVWGFPVDAVRRVQ
ncbi:MAG: nuclease-like protein [Halioglobus sp.]|nr:nuclease-like protein [Halioglobus sp.]